MFNRIQKLQTFLIAAAYSWILIFPAKPEEKGKPLPIVSTESRANAPSISAEDVFASARKRLADIFDVLLQEPAAYSVLAEKECRMFPEGVLYPYALPALGYGNLAIRAPQMKNHAREQMIKLIDMSILQAEQIINPEGGSLKTMQTYQNQGTFLGTLNLALGHYQYSTGDARYAELHNHLSAILLRAVQDRNGFPIQSYPSYTWGFDTIVVLGSLDLHDRIHGEHQSKLLIEKHIAWIEKNGTHLETGLPFSSGQGEKGFSGLPRGCDLSFRLCLMSQFAPAKARKVYNQYTTHYWVDGMVKGFSEWPAGTPGPADKDSGPIYSGIGLAATGMGFGTVQAMNDEIRKNQLAAELMIAEPLVKLAASEGIKEMTGLDNWFQTNGLPIQSKYFTGFLYGDAALFYAITWGHY